MAYIDIPERLTLEPGRYDLVLQATPPPPPPPVDPPVIELFQVAPSHAEVGQTVFLNWRVTGAEVTAGGVPAVAINGEVVAAEGSITINPDVAGTVTFTLAAVNAGGMITAIATLTVVDPVPPPPNPAVIELFETQPSTLAVGESSNLMWRVVGAASVQINGRDQAPSGVLPITTTVAGTLTFDLVAQPGDVRASTAVTFTNPTQPPPAGPDYVEVDGHWIKISRTDKRQSKFAGNFSNPDMWSPGPLVGSLVEVKHDVTYDVVSDDTIDLIVIHPGGKLIFRTDIDTRLKVVTIVILPGGQLVIGTVSAPVIPTVKAEVIFADKPFDDTDPGQLGHGLLSLGSVTTHGTPAITFVRLLREAKRGDKTLSLANPVTGWKAGDRVILPDSHLTGYREITPDPEAYQYRAEWEVLTVTSVSPDGLTVTLTNPLAYDHLGSHIYAEDQAEFLPHVALMNHNVIIKSENARGTRGYSQFTGSGLVNIRFTHFSGLGRTRNESPNDTTYDTDGNPTRLGTNQNGRYPVYFNHLYGPTVPPQNGYQYSFVGNTVSCPLDPMPFKWGLTVNDSHYGLIRDNVLYNWAGTGMVFESGNEYRNAVLNNFVTRVNGTGLRLFDWQYDGNVGQDGTGYWFFGPFNFVEGNVACDCRAQYGFGVSSYRAPTVWVPEGPGKPGTVETDVRGLPLLQFRDNEAYGCAGGFVAWDSLGLKILVGERPVIRDCRVWNFLTYGIFSYIANNLLLDKFIVRNGYGEFGNSQGIGVYPGDYLHINMTIHGADIRGCQIGIQTPGHGDGSHVIKDCVLHNTVNIQCDTPWQVAGGGVCLPQTTTIINTRYGPGQTGAVNAISMNCASDQPGRNFLVRFDVYVRDHNGVSGDNFRVYYYEQQKDVVIPYVEDGGYTVCANEPNMTNAQHQAKYGTCLAGSIAPDDVTARGDVYGYIKAGG